MLARATVTTARERDPNIVGKRGLQAHERWHHQNVGQSDLTD